MIGRARARAQEQRLRSGRGAYGGDRASSAGDDRRADRRPRPRRAHRRVREGRVRQGQAREATAQPARPVSAGKGTGPPGLCLTVPIGQRGRRPEALAARDGPRADSASRDPVHVRAATARRLRRRRDGACGCAVRPDARARTRSRTAYARTHNPRTARRTRPIAQIRVDGAVHGGLDVVEEGRRVVHVGRVPRAAGEGARARVRLRVGELRRSPTCRLATGRSTRSCCATTSRTWARTRTSFSARACPRARRCALQATPAEALPAKARRSARVARPPARRGAPQVRDDDRGAARAGGQGGDLLERRDR